MNEVQPIRDRNKLDAIKKILKAQSKRDYLLFVLGINSGLRIADILDMHVGDVIDENGKPRQFYELREGKTGKAKRFPFNKSVQDAIIVYLQGFHGDLDRYLFASRKGEGSITRQTAWQIINDAARAVGIAERIGTHSLRKTFGYFAHKSGADMTRIQHLLNHSSPAVTLRYIGIQSEELDAIYMNLNL